MYDRSGYDCVIIGGGHNGLTAAAYLAKAGKRVCVLERRSVLGGACTTEELWPGYKVSTAAYVVSLLEPEIIRDLRLAHYGLRILPRSPSSFTPLLDGRSLTLGPDQHSNQAEISRFSQHDATSYPRYESLLDRVARVLEPILRKAAPDPIPVGKSWRHLGVAKKVRDGRAMWDIYQAMSALGPDLPEAIELLTGAATTILNRWFESEVLKATLATDAIIGSFTSPSALGSAYVLLHHVMGEAGGARGVWGYIQGGMGGLATALEKACLDLGVHIVRDAEVQRIMATANKVTGVLLLGGNEISAPVVASSVDAHWTFERFLDPGELPDGFCKAVARIDYSSASAKINVALGEPPDFTCLPSQGIAPHHRGTIHIGPTLEYLERAYDDAKYGRPSREPVLEITIPTSVDDSIAPPGKHIMSIFVQYAPYRLADGDWQSVKESVADRCLDLLASYAPNVPAAVIHRQIISPQDLENSFRLTGGNIFQGAMSPGQLFFMRPVVGWADHRTPIDGLYLCGAASHPGGGVMGTCGRNAAREILRDG